MKFLFVLLFTGISCITFGQTTDSVLLQAVEVTAVRAGDLAPVPKTNISKEEIIQKNMGQDLPFILNAVPSVIVNSDAGNGIGYTGMRIRGTDGTRINVTVNGIPYNDAESQGTFFVDMPDIASSAQSIQVQPGVGTSSNGSGAFGGSVNITTNQLIQKRNVEFNNSFGSYHSFKNSLIYNSGIFKKHFAVDLRASSIRSDGYIDRASSRLYSYYASAAYVTDKNSIRLNIISGNEKTYQAWNGVSEQMLQVNRRYNSAGTEKPGTPYTNEVDNYKQNHYQLYVNHKFNNSWKAALALFLTKGNGYYEQYKAEQLLADYGLPDYDDGSTIHTTTDLVRRLWLDNDFYGSVFSFHYDKRKTNIIIGGNINNYKGRHFGEVIYSGITNAIPEGHRWYDVDADKSDISLFTKWTQKVNIVSTYLDLQVRKINYKINGFRNNPTLKKTNEYFFFNPKAGLTYTHKKNRVYFSLGFASKEPNRDDFESGSTTPLPEHMSDIEVGIERKHAKSTYGLNWYFMNYYNQLVLTGKINDVGAYTRTNIKKSYRTGVELQWAAVVNHWISFTTNATVSINKIKGFTEYTDDYDNGGQITKYYSSPDIAFSPAFIAMGSVKLIPIKNAAITLTGKQVSRQYLDNTNQKSRSLNPYYVQDVLLSYEVLPKKISSIKLFLQINNLFSEAYEANGYTFTYFYENKFNTENYYFPMAPVNVMFGLNITL